MGKDKMTLSYEEFSNAKKLLKINKTATFPQIKEQYHELLQKYHPDKNTSNNESHKKTIEIMKAYETITKYCQNYTFCLSEEEFNKQTFDKSYDENSHKYNNWWKENYGKQELF